MSKWIDSQLKKVSSSQEIFTVLLGLSLSIIKLKKN